MALKRELEVFQFFIHCLNLYKSEVRDFPGGPVAKTQHSSAGGPGLIPGQGTRSHMPQPKILSATTKTWSSQINIKK